jgi:hypothetical protein
MTSHNQSDKKSVTLEGLTIQNTRDLKVLCIWPPMNNFSLIKKSVTGEGSTIQNLWKLEVLYMISH